MSDEQVLHMLDRHLAAENAHDLAGTLATLVADWLEVADGTAPAVGGRSA